MCPRAAIGNEPWGDLEIWNRWKLIGCLPFKGTMDDQPCWVPEIIVCAELGIRGPVTDLEMPERPEGIEVEPPKGLEGLSDPLQAYFARKVDTTP